jgi:hypothetical protein
LIDHFGELVVNKLAGVLVATDTGGFIHDYLAHRAKAQPSPAQPDTTKTTEVPIVDDTPTQKLPRPAQTRRKAQRKKRKSRKNGP